MAAGSLAAEPPTSKRYLALGDSYTIGQGVPESDRWPVQLVRELSKSGEKFDAPVIIARTGWTTSDLLSAMDELDLRGPFDLVSLLIGVNNQFRGLSVDDYRAEFKTLLKRSVQLAGGKPERVVVLSIPDWGRTPFADGRDRERIAREIDVFNRVNQEESRAVGVIYVDITFESRADAKKTGMIAGDGLHPSGKMYGAWGELVLQALKKQRR